jgi:hypothetical protein
MIRRLTLISALACATGFALAAPGGAMGATTVGQTAPDAGSVLTCGGATLFLTPTVGAAPDYFVPTGGGVLTSWSVQGPTSLKEPPTDDLKLKVVRSSSANSYVIAAEDIFRSIVPGVLNTFPIRIPVSGGEIIALWVPNGSQPCTFFGPPGDVQEYRGGSFAEPAIGATFVTDSTDVGRRTNVSAKLEPDADHDGFGDETQDQCLGQAGSSNGCLPPPAAAPVQPVAKKKCKKKKHKRYAESAKKKKCKKKKK